jgi:hypothetical protein
MDMTFGSFRFLVGKEGAHRFLAPIFSGPLAAEHDSSRSSTSSTESGEEETPPPHIIKPDDSGKLDDLFSWLTFGSVVDANLRWGNVSDSFTDFDFTNSAGSSESEEVFTDLYDGVTYPLHNIKVESPAPRRNSRIQDPELGDNIESTYHHKCMLTASGREVQEDKQSEAFYHWITPWSIPQISIEERETNMLEPSQESRCNFLKLHGTELQGS